MNLEYFYTLYNYNYWASARILHATENVTTEEFLTPTSFSHGSLRGTLAHTVSAEWVWLNRWQGVSPKAGLDENDFPSLNVLRTRWREEEQKNANIPGDVARARFKAHHPLYQHTRHKFRTTAVAHARSRRQSWHTASCRSRCNPHLAWAFARRYRLYLLFEHQIEIGD